ncbi:cobalt-precorrin-5B (C(1))-methyltransferase CbiD [Thermosediminibacter oceani]|uniref:Cobalt-precorrin-5B C(1)-methyltransferase n=1 Tax=Thermosediminibacter oceani (strain ATCC BAA-1034 / DSM 16646 / JW/IW-1228P) TaxID=555079 RepID=D9S0S8_THEOJ|nr:cobalt-precorrin-5B (C(1))-methyltransferase CbiD [Thermosediminibacter oceani]ADL07092.1 cobalamin biosynthesis protein CbiD [Thermosediminibacter oceani DSM 16646]
MDRYVLKNGKKLRCGYTTGSCAAAASKAAVAMLFNGDIPGTVQIETPGGELLTIKIESAQKGPDWAVCCVRKDGGDDPDVTHGLLVCAKVRKIDGEGILVEAGEGIGTVTKPGLPVKPGEPAINPVPMAMIKREVAKVLPEGCGVRLVLSIPGGEKVAEKTFNPRLGIVGGLSILGTTGIVEPMSLESLKETLALELSVLSAQGIKNLVLTPGNYGKSYAIKSGIDESLIVSCGNYLGFTLEKAVEMKFEEVHLVGDIGKLIKVAAGIFNTAGRVADARAEIMAAYAAYFGAGPDTVRKVLASNTTEEAMELIEKSGINLSEFAAFVAGRVRDKCLWYTGGKIEVSVELISNKRGLLAAVGVEKW